MTPTDLHGNASYYKHIVCVLYGAFTVCGIALIGLNLPLVECWMAKLLGPRKTFVLELYFWAALGATVASYKFFKEDKDINELENVMPSPDPTVLRYPNVFDVHLYVQRIIFSGVLGVIGAIILFAGLGYFDASMETWGFRQEMFFIVFCFLIGIYQDDFFAFLSGLKARLFQEKRRSKGAGTGEDGDRSEGD